MNLKQLRYFVRVVEAESLSKASELLCVAQPAIGLQIKHLEEELGTKLLVRHSRGVKPTEAGARLLEDAYDILRRIDDAMLRVRDEGDTPRGMITIGDLGRTIATTAWLEQKLGQSLPAMLGKSGIFPPPSSTYK
jgi:LysR family nitrogen assimilation transcriptional regulator